MQLQCHKCQHTWNYKGNSTRATCPHCKNKIPLYQYSAAVDTSTVVNTTKNDCQTPYEPPKTEENPLKPLIIAVGIIAATLILKTLLEKLKGQQTN